MGVKDPGFTVAARREQEVLSFIDMRAQYVPLSVCSKRLNIPLTMATDWDKDPVNAADIARRKTEIRETILAEKGITEPAIIASMGGILKKMMDELGQRTLEEEKTKDLVDGVLKVLAFLGTETTKAFDKNADPKQVTNIANIWMTINKQDESTSTQVADVIE